MRGADRADRRLGGAAVIDLPRRSPPPPANPSARGEQISIAEQIAAVGDAIAADRKELTLLRMMPGHDPGGETLRRVQLRIERLEAALITLRRAAAGAPPQRAAS